MSDLMNIDSDTDSSHDHSASSDLGNDSSLATSPLMPARGARASSPSNTETAARRRRTDDGSDNSDSLIARFKSIDLNRVPQTTETNVSPGREQPFPGATNIQNAMWKLIVRKVYSGFGENALPFTRQDEASFKSITSIPNAYRMIEQTTESLFSPSNSSTPRDPSSLEFMLRVYLEGALDAAALCQQIWDQRSAPAEDIRYSLQRLQDRYHNRVRWRFGDRSLHGLSILLSQGDFQSFLLDPVNEGWLSHIMVNTCFLYSISSSPDTYWLLDSAQVSTIWMHFTINDLPAASRSRINLPSRLGFNLLIPIWMGMHCTLATVDWTTGVIQYFNSQAMSYDITRTTAFTFIEWLLARRGAYRGKTLQRGNLHAIRQNQYCDCGVLAVEAGMAFVEQRPVRPYVPGLRATIMQDLVERCFGVDVPDWDHPNTPAVVVRNC